MPPRQSKNRAAPALCLRFHCTICGEMLSVPVDQLEKFRRDKCPACKRVVEFPRIAEGVEGYEQVIANGEKRTIDCPNCKKPLKVGREWPGATRQCLLCGTPLTLRFVPEPSKPQSAQPPPDVKAEPSPRHAPRPDNQATRTSPAPAVKSASADSPETQPRESRSARSEASSNRTTPACSRSSSESAGPIGFPRRDDGGLMRHLIQLGAERIQNSGCSADFSTPIVKNGY